MKRSIFRWVWDLISPAVPANQMLMKSTHPDRVLVFARHLISDRRRWTTGFEMRNKDGYETEYIEDAVSFCAAGAISACATTMLASNAALDALAKVINERRLSNNRFQGVPYLAVAHENDRYGYKATLEAFDEAIRRGDTRDAGGGR